MSCLDGAVYDKAEGDAWAVDVGCVFPTNRGGIVIEAIATVVLRGESLPLIGVDGDLLCVYAEGSASCQQADGGPGIKSGLGFVHGKDPHFVLIGVVDLGVANQRCQPFLGQNHDTEKFGFSITPVLGNGLRQSPCCTIGAASALRKVSRQAFRCARSSALRSD